MKRDDYAGLLFDYAVKTPEWTVDDATAALGWTHPALNMAIRRLRLTLGEADDINLVCTPQGKGERWVYSLTGNVEMAKPWVDNRLRDMEARLETMAGVAKSLVAATDGRSAEGRRARLIERAVRHLLEDLGALATGE